MKPCEQNCGKCGNTDLHIQHRLPGEAWMLSCAFTSNAKAAWKSEFLGFRGSLVEVLKECLTCHCRVCGFDWETAPSAMSKQAEPNHLEAGQD